jgi:hypothetical protein
VAANQAAMGAGIYSSASSPILKNLLIRDNVAAGCGGGLYLYGFEGTSDLLTLAGNTAQQGGGIAVLEGSVISLGDSIAWSCQATEGASLWIGTSTLPCAVQVVHSDVEGGQAGVFVSPESALTWGEGNLDVDPLFVSGILGAQYLSQSAAGQSANSPCVNAGSAAAADAGMDTRTTRTDEVFDSSAVDIGFHFPKYVTPTPTPEPTASPTPTDEIRLGVELEMPAAMFRGGDTCWLKAHLSNPGPTALSNVPVVVFLDINVGEYWFWPSWTHYPPDIDTQILTVPVGTKTVDILGTFAFPTGAGSAAGLSFWGAMLNSTMTALQGDLGQCQFGFDS